MDPYPRSKREKMPQNQGCEVAGQAYWPQCDVPHSLLQLIPAHNGV